MPKTILNTRNNQEQFLSKAALYLFKEMTRAHSFIISSEAAELHQQFLKYLKGKKATKSFENSIQQLQQSPIEQFQLIRKWLHAYTEQSQTEQQYAPFLNETTIVLQTNSFDQELVIKAPSKKVIPHLHGDHPQIQAGKYTFDFNEFIARLDQYETEVVPLYKTFTQTKKRLTDQYKKRLRLQEFQPKVLSAFVRNKLIDQVYLPIIGENLAKQIGTAGDDTRTDRMGMLLLISPPGYGKTTLMEYVANRLGLIFMKINGPAIGHHVVSVDPADAPNRAAKQELEKLNLAFEMGDNVMIYLDDIQHCNPEFLQKFISLCDAQRKIEGIWKGESKTYDFRGKRLCVIMAGNPYTESGDQFQIPDMLANRADIYNLGDIIGDSADVFKLSYIENALSSNHILARLAGKSMKDVYTLLKRAENDAKETLALEANHSTAELNEYIAILKKLLRIRDVILSVNQTYIQSAATSDEYRTEPAFKLQGSYRNMNKMAEKVVPIMNDQELETLILSHYEGESQTLTSAAEANFLKLKELMNVQTTKEQQRWQEIKTAFNKNKIFQSMDEQNPVSQVVAQMSRFTDELQGIKQAIKGE
ncbi:MAG: AAA family ATPase [Saprospiraceae bacterium]|nr:AAA family ATPase [Saprospiraceae bacterium]